MNDEKIWSQTIVTRTDEIEPSPTLCRHIVAAAVRAFPGEISDKSVAQALLDFADFQTIVSHVSACAARGWLERRDHDTFRATQAGAQAAGIYWWRDQGGAMGRAGGSTSPLFSGLRFWGSAF